MNSWNFENGVRVEVEMEYYTLKCYHDGEYIGRISPADDDDWDACIEALNNGDDPITDGWDDGCGNACNIDGWGDAVEDYDN